MAFSEALPRFWPSTLKRFSRPLSCQGFVGTQPTSSLPTRPCSMTTPSLSRASALRAFAMLALVATLALLAPLAQAQITLPIDFEESINYELTDFGGTSSRWSSPTRPTPPTRRADRPPGRRRSASPARPSRDVTGFTERIPFTADAQTMSVRVWSPEAGALVLFKVEEVGNPGLNVETYTYTTVAGAWETMVFDFGEPEAEHEPGAGRRQRTTRRRSSSTSSATTCRPRRFRPRRGPTTGTTSPSAVRRRRRRRHHAADHVRGTSSTTSFSRLRRRRRSLVADPTDATNRVVQFVRPASAECFAGTTVGEVIGFAKRHPVHGRPTSA